MNTRNIVNALIAEIQKQGALHGFGDVTELEAENRRIRDEIENVTGRLLEDEGEIECLRRDLSCALRQNDELASENSRLESRIEEIGGESGIARAFTDAVNRVLEAARGDDPEPACECGGHDSECAEHEADVVGRRIPELFGNVPFEIAWDGSRWAVMTMDFSSCTGRIGSGRTLKDAIEAL